MPQVLDAPARRVRVLDAVLGVLCAAFAVALGVRAGWHAAPGIAALGVVVAALVAPALTRIDVAERRLPNALTLPLLGVGLGCAAVSSLRGAWAGPALAVVVAVVLGVLWWTGGMGAGDVKLGAGLALAAAPIAWWVPVAALAAAFVLGGGTGVVARVRGADSVPFGPWLLAGTGIALVAASA